MVGKLILTLTLFLGTSLLGFAGLNYLQQQNEIEDWQSNLAHGGIPTSGIVVAIAFYKLMEEESGEV